MKTENILIDTKNVPKISDFGLSQLYSSEEIIGVGGTPSYMSPQLWVANDFDLLLPYIADFQDDIYALGR